VSSGAGVDKGTGPAMSSRALGFLRQAGAIEAGGRLPPDRAEDLLAACMFGEERITDEVGSDLFTRTASQAAAVAASAFSGEHSGFSKGKGLSPVRPLLRAIRGLAMVLYVLARDATSSMRTGFAELIAMRAVGGGVLAAA